ncbi:MAG: hypothetical protein AAF696_37460, partial [Bacteroidota bacterium]
MKLTSLIFTSIFAPFFLMISCNSVPQSTTFYEQMMEVHHKDMMVWGEIPELKNSIKSELESILADSTSSNTTSIDSRLVELEKELKSLENADDLMKDW